MLRLEGGGSEGVGVGDGGEGGVLGGEDVVGGHAYYSGAGMLAGDVHAMD